MAKERKRQRQELVDKLADMAFDSIDQESVNDGTYQVGILYCDQKRPYTYIKAGVVSKKDTYTASGFSKCCWPDRFDSEYGYRLALKKAMTEIVKAMQLSAGRQG